MVLPDRATPADREVLDRVAAARNVLEAIALGIWLADARVLDAVGRLIARAGMWARVADSERWSS